ncbi:hypothetical protein TNCV_4418201 [Trichonephila clavipes]|nr:hypothetical protein TNCV_4418201 [Trichonephila clavipes]
MGSGVVSHTVDALLSPQLRNVHNEYGLIMLENLQGNFGNERRIVSPYPNCHTTKGLSSTDLMRIGSLHCGSSVAPGLEPMTILENIRTIKIKLVFNVSINELSDSRSVPKDSISDSFRQGFTLKAMERENLASGVFGNGQSESDIRYKKASQLCRIMPNDHILDTLLLGAYLKSLGVRKVGP